MIQLLERPKDYVILGYDNPFAGYSIMLDTINKLVYEINILTDAKAKWRAQYEEEMRHLTADQVIVNRKDLIFVLKRLDHDEIRDYSAVNRLIAVARITDND